MKKFALFAFVGGLLLASCSQTCDCDYIVDNYTNSALNGYELTSSVTAAEDTCLDAGIIDSAYTGNGAYLAVSRVECP